MYLYFEDIDFRSAQMFKLKKKNWSSFLFLT